MDSSSGPYHSSASDHQPRYRKNTLWMGEIDQSGYMDENVICQLLGPAWLPHISNVKLIRNKFTGFPIGYGFIEFFNEEMAEQCLAALNGQPMPGMHPPRHFRLNYAQSSNANLPSTPAASSNDSGTESGTNESGAADGSPSASSSATSGAGERSGRSEYSVFVGDLDYLVEDSQLKDIFSERYATVTSARVIRDERGQSRGYGFVRFTDRFEQERSIREMNGLQLGQKHIRVSTATPKSSSNAFQQRQYGGGRQDPPFMARSYNAQYGQQQHQQQIWDTMTPEQTSAFHAQFYLVYQQLQQVMHTGHFDEFYANFQAQASQDTTGAYNYLLPTVQAQMPPTVLAAHHQPAFAVAAGMPPAGYPSQYQNGTASSSQHTQIGGTASNGAMHNLVSGSLRRGGPLPPQRPAILPAGGFNPLAKTDPVTAAFYMYHLRQALFTLNYNDYMQRMYNYQQSNNYTFISRSGQANGGGQRNDGFNPVSGRRPVANV